MIVVSSCLAGVACRYDGQDNLIPSIKKLVDQKKAIAVCPEVLGGLSIPRSPCERRHDKIISNQGVDCTSAYLDGAKKALACAKQHHCTFAILKSKSPSCGKDWIYDGTFTRQLCEGNGLTAELFLQEKICVINEMEWKEKEKQQLK